MLWEPLLPIILFRQSEMPSSVDGVGVTEAWLRSFGSDSSVKDVLVDVCLALGWKRLPRTFLGLGYSITGLRECLVVGSKNGTHRYPSFYERLVTAAGGCTTEEVPPKPLVRPPGPPDSLSDAAFLRNAELFVGEANASGGNDERRHAVLGSYQHLDKPSIFTVVEAGSTGKMVEELADSFSAMSVSRSLGYYTDTIVVGWSSRFEKIDSIPTRQIRVANELAKTQPVLLHDSLLKKNVLVLVSHLERGEEPRRRGLGQLEVIAETLRDTLDVDYCVAAGDYNSKPQFVAAHAPSFISHVAADTAASGTIDNIMTHKLDELAKTRGVCLGPTRHLDHYPIAVGFSSGEAARDASP